MSSKIRFSLRALFVLLTICCVATFWIRRATMKPPYMGMTEDIEGWGLSAYSLESKFEFSIPDDAALRSPIWHPSSANPPLSAQSALRIADRFRKEKLRDKDSWKWRLTSISLLPLQARSNKWLWSVEFVALPDSGGTSGAPTVPVFILMNGEVIVPRESQYDGLKEWGIMASEAP